MAPSLHPLIDNGITKGQSNFGGGDVLHNHACGCSQCWKPNGALFSVVAVTPDDNVKVTKNKDKLAVQNPDATILRTACKECGVHMYGPIEKDHAFKGLSFVHVELSDSKGWQEPQFAGFVPSLAEQDSSVNLDEVRQRLKDIGLESYDALNPPLMEALQKFEEEKSGKKGKL